MKSYLEISISSSEGQRELLIPTMIELGCKGFQETDSELLCYFEKSEWNETKHEALKLDIRNLLQTISANAAVRFREFKEENWNAQWEQSLEPIEIGDRLVVKPSWCSYENTRDRFVIEIDPKMSFGTGYHETTRLTLGFIEQYVRSGWDVLDVGTGTGILAIAAVKLGASHAAGTDTDDWALENATENVLRNEVAENVTISRQPLTHFPSSSFNLLCANLTLNTNLAYLGEFKRVLLPDGILILSGLLRNDREEMLKGLDMVGFSVIDERAENEWIAIAAQAR